ncbi:MAG TPA: hypothetical protein VG247_03115 [Pseudonocardiaceae bacterium]|jgi:hypothetical protein|nr:hypothetical protein [Pseudonocardiaceae bacterium]
MSLDHQKVLEVAWQAPGNTAIELPPVDVNQVLHDRYDVDNDFVFTGTMLWDMEVRKASHPDIYIPTVIEPGSVEKFPESRDDRSEIFTRVSDQRIWLDQPTYGTVIEHVRVDHEQQRIFFIGAPDYRTPDGRTREAGTGQPIFHVEHSVAGTEQRPINLWRIVHLTEQVDPALREYFEQLGRDPYLRVFIEVYLRENLGVDLTRLPAR